MSSTSEIPPSAPRGHLLHSLPFSATGSKIGRTLTAQLPFLVAGARSRSAVGKVRSDIVSPSFA